MAGRIIPPEETWRRIEPFLEKFGVTRVGEVTGLDIIGIPVWFAVRPNSRTLAVSQGKGIDDWSARVSAAMEALELAYAESHRIPIELATLEEISVKGNAVDISRLPQPRTSLFGTARQIYWTEATDWTDGSRWWVPYELVHTDATVPWMKGSGSFPCTSNGLASGNVREEALLHGLYEVIERDACALWAHSPVESHSSRRLDLRSVDDPAVRRLLDMIAGAGVTPLVWEVTSDVGISTFQAIFFDERFDPATRPLPAASGFGCHAERSIALIRALTEAAQSRLTIIAGARDDLDRGRYRVGQDTEVFANLGTLAKDREATRRFHEVPSVAHGTLRDAIDHAVSRLKEAGMDQVLFVDLSAPDVPVAVTRIIVPGLEGPTQSPSYTPGARARRSVKVSP